MNQALQDALKEAYAVAPSKLVIIDTLEIRQTGVQEPVYITKSRQPVIAQDEDGNTVTFQPVGFQFALPPSNEEGFQSLNLAIDNVGRQVMDFIEAAKSTASFIGGVPVPVEVVYRPYASTDLTAPQMVPPLVLYLKDVQINALQITGRATFMDIVNKKFPSELYIRSRFPALG